MKTTVKNSGGGYAYQKPELQMMSGSDIICSSPVGAIQDLTPETDQTTWENLY